MLALVTGAADRKQWQRNVRIFRPTGLCKDGGLVFGHMPSDGP